MLSIKGTILLRSLIELQRKGRGNAIVVWRSYTNGPRKAPPIRALSSP
jgi:hypothetical protein